MVLPESPNPMRTVERLVEGDWHVCDLKGLNKGDTFRMFEPTGEPVGVGEYIATGEPYMTDWPGPVWGIAAEPKGEE